MDSAMISGMSDDMTVGLFSFEPIFKLILAFGGSEYTGNPTAKPAVED